MQAAYKEAHPLHVGQVKPQLCSLCMPRILASVPHVHALAGRQKCAPFEIVHTCVPCRIRASLTRCVKNVSRGAALVALGGAFKRLLAAYAQELYK